jgi:predicted NACHT family NTPase
VLDKSGLSQAQQDYEFLHLTFQEYYTAIYLMEGLSSEELEVKIDAEKGDIERKIQSSLANCMVVCRWLVARKCTRL